MHSAVDPDRSFAIRPQSWKIAYCSMIAAKTLKSEAKKLTFAADQRTIAANFQKSGSNSRRSVMNVPLPGNSSFSIWIYWANRLFMTNDSESKRLGDTDSSCVMMWGEVSTTSGSSGVAGIIFSLSRHRIHTKSNTSAYSMSTSTSVSTITTTSSGLVSIISIMYSFPKCSIVIESPFDSTEKFFSLISRLGS